MKQLLNLLLICLFSATMNAQTQLPYRTGFDNSTEKLGWTEYRKGDNGLSNWIYETNTPLSSPTKLAHYYPVGGSIVTDDWFVSPPFSFLYGGKIDSLFSSFSGFGMPATSDTIAVYLLYGNADPSLASSKTLLIDFKTNYVNDNTWRDTFSVPIPASTSTTYIAFRYKTINNWLDISFDNLKLSSNAASSVDPMDISSINYDLYPNPCNNGVLSLSKQINPSEHQIDIHFYSINGKKVCHLKPQKSNFQLSLNNGIYYYIIYQDGLVASRGQITIKHE